MRGSTDRPTFDLGGPLPHGRLAIEASAGTGKTFTLAGLAARYVVEDQVRASELLIVTFTRAAAAELRDRVRARLVDVLEALRRPDPPPPGSDPLLTLLATTDRPARELLVAQAVADFDAATVTTIHGFAQQVLTTLGTAAPGDLDATLVDDTVLLVRQVATDRLATAAVRGFPDTDLLPGVGALAGAAMTVLGNPGIAVVPTLDGTDVDALDAADPTAAQLVLRALVDEVVDEVHRRRRAAGTLAFDDVLTQLRDALTGPAAAAPVEALRRRFRVALIDEFQDTDPVQWDIFRTLFGRDGTGSTLVLVGDPKQAIYAFRGANVHTYLDAANAPGTDQSTLGTNWRSDGAVLSGLESLLGGATFGDPRIAFLPVQAAPGHEARRLRDPAGAPLPAIDLRLAIGPGIARNRGKDPATRDVSSGDAERAIGDDLGRRVVELLETGRIPVGEGGAVRPVRPGDIAVLVGSHADAAAFLDRLRAHGVPAVVARGASVLASPAATHWRWLLEALDQPHVPNRARTAALSWFEGWSPARLDAATDDDLTAVTDDLYRWADTLAAHGVVELCRELWADTGVATRVLATPTGDRDLTDLEHIAELLQAGAGGRRLTPAGLLGVLAQIAAQRDDTDPENDVAARRTESEAEAVQIMTVWASKGLEFPIVCIPTMWRASYANAKQTIFRDPESGTRTFDLTDGGAWPDAAAGKERKALAKQEAVGENLRLLYVALTRSRHQAVVWWTRAQNTRISGLSRLLFARADDGTIDPDAFGGATGPTIPGDDDLLDTLAGWLDPAGDVIRCTAIDAASGRASTWTDPTVGGPLRALAVAELGRMLPRDRHRWSFTTISARAHPDGIDPFDESLGETGAGDEGGGDAGDEPAPADGGARDGSAEPAAPPSTPALPLGGIAGGADFGTLVHDVLEHVDFTADDLDAELRAPIEDRLRWSHWPVTADELVTGLRAAIETPLGPLFEGRRLRDLARADRLDELSFELPLGEAGRPATDRSIGTLLTAHLPERDPLRPWALRLAGGLFSVDLAGHLTGSIDAVFRVRSADGTPRFVVCDYKTNTLGARGRPSTSEDYHPDRLPAAMAEHHYPLQALLYSVALHRFLRWRLADYDPARHLGGVAYLFLRGLAGPDTPAVDGNPHGLFAWTPPSGLVGELSDLLDGRGTPSGTVGTGAQVGVTGEADR